MSVKWIRNEFSNFRTLMFLLLFNSTILIGGNQDIIDSLKTSSDEINRCNDLERIGLLYKQINLDSAWLYIEKAIKCNGYKENYYKKAILHTDLFSIKRLLGYIDKKDLLRAKKLSEKIVDVNKKYEVLGIVSGNYGSYYMNQKKYDSASNYYLQALDHFDKAGNDKFKIPSYSALAIIMRTTKDYKSNLKYCQRMLEISKREGKYQYAYVCHNLAIAYIDLKEIDSATKYLRLSIGYAKVHDLYSSLIGSYNTMAFMFDGLIKKRDSAIFYLKEAEKLSVKYKFYAKSALVNQNIGYMYFENEEYKKANSFFNRALAFAKKTNELNRFKDLYKHKTSLYPYINKDSVNYYFELFLTYSDSIQNKESILRATEIEAKFRFKEKELLITSLEKEKKLQKRNNFYLLIALSTGFVLILGLILFFFYRYKHKKKLEVINTRNRLETEIFGLEQKILLSQMSPHFIFNSLNSIKSFIIHKKDDDAIEYLGKFASLTRKVLTCTREKTITLEKEILLLNDYLEIEQNRFSNKFNFTIEVEGQLINEIDDVKIPPMLLQPIAENAVIHGVANLKRSGKIKISFDLISDEILLAKIYDNGNGIIKNQNKEHQSLAQHITFERIRNFNQTHSLGVEMNFPKVQQGTLVELTIPIS